MSNELNADLILHRLEEISRKQDEFNKMVGDLTIEITKVKTIEHTVDGIREWKEKLQENISTAELLELKEWKNNMEELMSPTQLKQHLKEHDSFKTFKTQAMMIWIVVQALMGLAIFWDKIFG